MAGGSLRLGRCTCQDAYGDQKTGSWVIAIEPLEDVFNGLPLEIFQTGQGGS